jgi:hypothetical protein
MRSSERAKVFLRFCTAGRIETRIGGPVPPVGTDGANAGYSTVTVLARFRG